MRIRVRKFLLRCTSSIRTKSAMANAGINGDRHKVARQSAAAPDTSPKKVMVEEQSFVSGLSVYLSGLHADRIERSAKGEDCEIKLVFRP